ncbi:MAG: hypothetical protein QM487_00780 [Candidatus Marithrix sp.]
MYQNQQVSEPYGGYSTFGGIYRNSMGRNATYPYPTKRPSYQEPMPTPHRPNIFRDSMGRYATPQYLDNGYQTYTNQEIEPLYSGNEISNKGFYRNSKGRTYPLQTPLYQNYNGYKTSNRTSYRDSMGRNATL